MKLSNLTVEFQANQCKALAEEITKLESSADVHRITAVSVTLSDSNRSPQGRVVIKGTPAVIAAYDFDGGKLRKHR
jgi:hypothetical protein